MKRVLSILVFSCILYCASCTLSFVLRQNSLSVSKQPVQGIQSDYYSRTYDYSFAYLSIVVRPFEPNSRVRPLVSFVGSDIPKDFVHYHSDTGREARLFGFPFPGIGYAIRERASGKVVLSRKYSESVFDIIQIGYVTVMPLQLAASLLAWMICLWLLWCSRRVRRRNLGMCVECGYLLQGTQRSVITVCPECGQAARYHRESI